jgi:hypothetical protein
MLNETWLGIFHGQAEKLLADFSSYITERELRNL